MNYAKQLAVAITERFKSPIKLKFEKIYFPSILIQRKRYAGLQWTNPYVPDKVDCKVIS